jgi:hypothetical protein
MTIIDMKRLTASPHTLTPGGSWPIGLTALGIHTAAMLATIATVSIVVYKWVGVAFLRRGWINFDLVWTMALVVCGILLLAI